MEPWFYGWMPSQCVFPELTATYPVFGDREFFIDKNLTRRIPVGGFMDRKAYNYLYTQVPLTSAAAGQLPASVSAKERLMIITRYHGEHCLFQWRKLQYSLDHHVDYVDNKTISFYHSSHCTEQLSQGCEGPHDVSEIELGFFRCRSTPVEKSQIGR